MPTFHANGDSPLSFWLRVREFAVPPSMIETATRRRLAGDWAGACAAAGFDVDLDLRAVARSHGSDLAARIRADLRRLAPDLLRWHLPRIGPDGLLRPGLTSAVARYDRPGDGDPLHLVVRTAPAWADAGQRISLALWDRSSRTGPGVGGHPHPRPDRRHRLDLHRHLWDAERSGELYARSGADRPDPPAHPHTDHPWLPGLPGLPAVPEPAEPTEPAGLSGLSGLSEPAAAGAAYRQQRCAVDRWAAEAGILLAAEGRTGAGTVAVRLGGSHRLFLDLTADLTPDGGDGASGRRITAATTDPPARRAGGVPVLPDAATWVPPDLELLRAGAIDPGRLHPLVATALAPGSPPAPPARTADAAGQARLVDCRGVPHRIGLVDGVLAPLDHGPAEIRREELLIALGGTPFPCLQAVDRAHRHPDCLPGVRERLEHGDTAGALAVVEALLGPEAVLRDGPLRDALQAAAQRRITYGLFRAGLVNTGPGPARATPRRRRERPARSPRALSG